MKRNLAAVLAQLVRHAPPLLAKDFKPDCCIAATRVAVNVLTQLGFTAGPQPTRLVVYTKKLWRRVEAGKPDPPFLPGEWSVGLGYGGDKRYDTDPYWKGYDGHLVATVLDPDATRKTLFIVDLSLGQAARPQKGILLPPALFTPKQKVTLGGCVLLYHNHDNPAFTKAPDWVDEWKTDPIIEELLEII